MTIICVFGESTTLGAWDLDKGGWVNRLNLGLAPILNYELETYNLGISNQITEDILKRLDNESESREPDIIIISTGGNDACYVNTEDKPRVSLDKFKDNIQKIIKLAKKHTNKIVFLGLRNVNDSITMPIPWDKTIYYSNKKMKQYDGVIKELCEKNKVYFIEFYGSMEKNDFDEDDGLHPNADGHEKIYKKVKDFLIKNKLI